jgi:hypothetical protein
VYWIPGNPSPPAPGPLQRPIFIDKEQEEEFSPIKKTLVRRCLTRRTTSKHKRHEDPLTTNPHEDEDQVCISRRNHTFMKG